MPHPLALIQRRMAAHATASLLWQWNNWLRKLNLQQLMRGVLEGFYSRSWVHSFPSTPLRMTEKMFVATN